MICIIRSGIACVVLTCAATAASAQISLITAVDLALKNSPKVLMAQADVDKCLATWQQLRDAYIPVVVGGSGIGPPSYGFPLGQPSIFNITASSLVFSYSQHDYLRAAKAAYEAANLTLKDARESVAEDTAITYLALDRDLQRQAALREQQGFADRLVAIVQQRLDAGQATQIDLTTARLTAAQIKLTRLRAEDDTDIDKAHLARLVSLPLQGISTASDSVPPFPAASPLPPDTVVTSPAVESAYAIARSKRETAFGDARYQWRPQIYFTGEYSRFASYTNIQDYYSHFQHNNAAVGVQINVPIFDMGHRAKARESAADFSHSLHEADMLRDQFFDTRLRASRTAAELAARAEVATLDQELAKQNLGVLVLQLQNGTGNIAGPQMSPKDEQNARIIEREKFIALLNANFEAAQAQIDLLRATGQLQPWLTNAASAQPVTPPKP